MASTRNDFKVGIVTDAKTVAAVLRPVLPAGATMAKKDKGFVVTMGKRRVRVQVLPGKRKTRIILRDLYPAWIWACLVLGVLPGVIAMAIYDVGGKAARARMQGEIQARLAAAG
jgi:hypothetical protein